jgi:hypothetical protein
MKKIFLFLLCYFSLQIVYAQTDNSFQGLEVYGSYSKLSFLNPTFSYNTNNQVIGSDFGFEAGGKVIHRNFMINLAFVQTNYQMQATNLFVDNSTRFRGVEGGFSLFLFPMVSKYFSPYAGLGYVNASVEVVKSTKTGSGSTAQTNDDLQAATPINSALWKFGIRAAYGRMSLSGEYKQTFGNDEKAFNMLSITLGIQAYRINHNK